ncbi:MAG: cyclic nucleotide-binding domain-containing protein [Actinomycetia bacterium]|nr:cyclic nucleotide-binding domain-containing protein [Actinomycetes bacterium]
MLELCESLPVRSVTTDEVVVVEDEPTGQMFVVVSGHFAVTRQGEPVAMITEPGAVIGEVSALLDSPAGATVTATSDGELHVIDDPAAFLATNTDGVHEIARLLAARLNRLVGYLADLKAQYGATQGHLGLVDEVLSKLTFSPELSVEPGSERDPDPQY